MGATLLLVPLDTYNRVTDAKFVHFEVCTFPTEKQRLLRGTSNVCTVLMPMWSNATIGARRKSHAVLYSASGTIPYVLLMWYGRNNSGSEECTQTFDIEVNGVQSATLEYRAKRGAASAEQSQQQA